MARRRVFFPRIRFIVTNSKFAAGKVVKVYNGPNDVENRIEEGKDTLRWDKSSCHRFAANQARLLMGVLASNLLHVLRQFCLRGEEVKQSIQWLIKRLIKVGAKVAYHGRRWPVYMVQPSRWLDTTGLCSGKGPRAECA